MSDSILLIGILFALSAGLLGFVFVRVYQTVRPTDRAHMDPLPKGVRLLWPLIHFLQHAVTEHLMVDYLEKVNKQLVKSGMDYLYTPEEFIAIRIAVAILTAVGITVFTIMVDLFDWRAVAGATILAFMLPRIKMGEYRKKREAAIIRALPTYMDFLTMAVEAGMNLSGALGQAVEKGPESPIRGEFERVLRDIRAGFSRLEAFEKMAERLEMPVINSLVSALAQSEKTGSNLGNVLRIQANQQRIERFQRAEKAALEAPVKLIIPLVFFIFPVTFLILAFPILMKFMYEM